jgi:hypothetical protein
MVRKPRSGGVFGLSAAIVNLLLRTRSGHERVESGSRTLDRVGEQVAIGAVDLLDACTHEVCELEQRDAGGDREGGERMAEEALPALRSLCGAGLSGKSLGPRRLPEDVRAGEVEEASSPTRDNVAAWLRCSAPAATEAGDLSASLLHRLWHDSRPDGGSHRPAQQGRNEHARQLRGPLLDVQHAQRRSGMTDHFLRTTGHDPATVDVSLPDFSNARFLSGHRLTRYPGSRERNSSKARGPKRNGTRRAGGGLKKSAPSDISSFQVAPFVV